MSFFRELKRRNVFRVAAAYLVAGWLLIEVSATLEGTLHLPDWADTLLAYFIILGFPIVVFFSWAYEITPEGIKREKDIAPGDASRAETARRLDWAVIVLFVMAASLFVVERFVLDEPEAEPFAEPPLLVEQRTFTADGDAPDGEDVATTPELSIAVLPFVNMSPDPEQEYFSDGLTEELINLLAGVGQLKVAARTSSFFYKDKLGDIPLTEIARELRVAHVLEGSVRRSGDRMRVTAQLIKADDGFHLWSNTWDRTFDDIFAIQDEIAAAVTEQLQVTLLGEAPKATVVDTESYELTLQGRYLFSRRNEGDMEKALELFERAVELDPNNATAWVGVAPLYHWIFDPPRVEDALAATERAVTLDPDNPEAWSRRAYALWTAGDEEAGASAWSQAVRLGEDNPLIQSQIAGYLALQGDLEGAIEAQKRAVALDPLYLVNLGNLSSDLILAGRLDEARVHAEKVLILAPDNRQALGLLAQIRLLQGRPAEAREMIDRQSPEAARSGAGSDSTDFWGALIEHALGHEQAADAALERFIAAEGDLRPVSVACLYAWRGEKDTAFAWLDRALEQYPDMSVQYSWEPWLDSLEDDPRWENLMKRWTGTEFLDNP
jgi:TolB-like protein/Tfp pilus assembly protein PilF